MTHLWRASLQFRIVTSTMLLGLIVLSIVVSYLYTAIAGGLEEDRVGRAEQQALALAARAQVYVDAFQQREGDAQGQLAIDLVNQLAPPGDDQSLHVVFTRSLNNTGTTTIPTVSSPKVGLSAVSEALRTAVAADPDQQQTQLTTVALDGAEIPAVIVGSQIEVPVMGTYDLYFITPMYRSRPRCG